MKSEHPLSAGSRHHHCDEVARTGPTGSVRLCPLIGVDRKRPAHAQIGANDPNRSFGSIALDTEFYLDEYFSGLKRK